MVSSPNQLPPGFRFHPTDEELILHYLRNRAASVPCPVAIIADVDIYKFDPWELPCKAAYGDREWYFFSPRDRKYPNGVRPNRAAGSGYWKATGTDKPIRTGGGSEHVGVKKALVFYKGRPPKGVKTDWIMHEYRLADPPVSGAGGSFSCRPMKFRSPSMRLDDWVLCRIYKKSLLMSPATAEMMINLIDEGEQDLDYFTFDDGGNNASIDVVVPPPSTSAAGFLDDYSYLVSGPPGMSGQIFSGAGSFGDPLGAAVLDQTIHHIPAKRKMEEMSCYYDEQDSKKRSCFSSAQLMLLNSGLGML